MSEYINQLKIKERYKEVKTWARDVGVKDTERRVNRLTYEQSLTKDAIENKTPCEKCGSIKDQTLDHIVPKDILNQFGFDHEKEIMEENYRVLCRRCNHFKGKQLDFSHPKTKEILLKLLNLC